MLSQLRTGGRDAAGRVAERVDVGLTVAAAVALAITASISPPAALAAWGLWALLSGVTQLLLSAGAHPRPAGG